MDKEITYELLLSMLKELDSDLGKLGEKVLIDIYGGFVMCAEFKARNSTKDIDAVFTNTKTVYTLSRKIAKKYSVDSEWLNDSIMTIKTVLKKEKLHEFGNFKNINARVPSAEQMLAMKIYASRQKPYKDLDDCLKLCAILKLNKESQLKKVFLKFFPKERYEIKQDNFIYRICKGANLENNK